jgi:Omp85 superfamily domain
MPGRREWTVWIRYIFSTAILLCLVLLVLKDPNCRAQPRNQSKLKVALIVRKGKLSVDRSNRTSFDPSDYFKQHLGKPYSDALREKIRRFLIDDLDKVFAKTAQVYWYALSNAEQRTDLEGALTDDSTKKVRSYATSDWTSFKVDFTAWSTAGSNRFGLQQALASMLADSAFTENLANTALVFSPEVNEETGLPNYDADSGTIQMQVGDPVSSWSSTADFVVCLPADLNDHCTGGEQPAPEAAVVRKLLGELPNQLWRPIAIRSLIEDYYGQKGFLPTVAVAGAADARRWINIQRSPRIGRILLPSDACDKTTAKILYLLLPDHDFRFFVNSKTCLIRTQTVTIPSDTPGQPDKVLTFNSIDYLALGEHRVVGVEPFLNQLQLQNQQLQLSQIGFVLTQRPAGGRDDRIGKSYVDLDVLKMANQDTASSNQPDNASGSGRATTDQGFADSRPQDPALQRAPLPRTPSVPVTPLPRSTQTGPRERNNYLGGGFDYKPGQGVRPLAFYQRSHVGPGSLALQAGSQGSGLGSVSYVADFALFGNSLLGRRFFRRLSVQFMGSTDFESNRLFSGVQTDERRTGGMGQADLELFRDLHGHMLRFSLAGRRTTVELLQNDKSVGKQNLTLLDLGAFYLFQGDESHFPRSLRLEPRVRMGLRLGTNEPRFTAFSLTGNFHQKLPHLFEADVSGRIETDSRGTPLFEQASFGGADVVRGFRKDDAIGRSLWSLQNEFWLPLPGTSAATEGPAFFLRRNVRLASFVDVGAAHDTTGSKSGFRVGPGVGARVIYNLVVLKIDWAYGIGDAATGRSHGRFYFGVSFNRPF